MEEKKEYTKNEFHLITEVIKLSNSKTWEEAKKEWKTKFIDDNPFWETCLCTHYPIKEVNIMENTLNFNQIRIGNCCVKKFFDIKTYDKLFKALKEKRINKIILETLYKNELINDFEYGISKSCYRKKYLSKRQEIFYPKVKEKILKLMEKGVIWEIIN